MAPDVLLFDLGGVVIDIDIQRIFARWAEYAGCGVEHISSRVRFDGAYHCYERGEISVQEFFGSLREALDIDLADDQFLDGWNAIFVGEMPGIAAALGAARRQWPLYAFSNTNGAHVDCFSVRFSGVLNHFRHVFISSDIGLRKPDHAAFEHVVKEIGVPAHRILFFDDVAENIAGARAVGLQSVHVATRQIVAETLALLQVSARVQSQDRAVTKNI